MASRCNPCKCMVQQSSSCCSFPHADYNSVLTQSHWLGMQAQSLLKMMQLIGALSGGRTITQVALNWLMAKGAATDAMRAPFTCTTHLSLADMHTAARWSTG